MNTALKLAVIGAGIMGRNHLRAAQNAGIPIAGIYDSDITRAQAASHDFGCPVLETLNGIEAAIIVVPTAAHFPTALPLLKKGVHCLVEKPYAATEDECRQLIEAAAVNRAVLQVGHIERFNPAIQALLARRPSGITQMAARRAGPASARVTDVSVVLDLMVHDLDVILALNPQAVTQVTATGTRDDATAQLAFADGSTASVMASRVAQERLRDLSVTTRDQRFKVDYIAKSVAQDEAAAETFTGDALGTQMRDFIDSIATQRLPRVTGESALAVMKLAWRIEAALGAS
jgi:UDP-N-acetylglucosamine 3-dehydrogenase